MAGDSSNSKMKSESRGNDRDHALEDNRSILEREPSLPYPDSAVAITGVACKFPGSDSLEEFWKVLESGTSMCRDLPQDRFPDARFERRGHSRKFKGNLMNDVDAFDHKFFNISSREAAFMDPQQRLALQVTYQALESAGYFTHQTTEAEREIGCYMAICANEYAENVATHPPSAFTCTGTVRPFIAGKVNHYFGFSGPAIMLDTACAASGTAIHQACRAIVSGECVGALAGATNVFVSPDIFQNLAGGHFLSPTGASKSFDASADGYCRGEGVAMIVLKKLSAALRDGDPIRGVIAGTALNQNSNEVSITIPHAPSQMNLYRKALQMAGVDAQDISYVEAHGTGTPVGDPIEAESIRGVFGDSSRPYNEKTYMGSLKSNIGHTEASAGISGLIKVLLMMQKGVIPKQAIFRDLNPRIPSLEKDGIEIPTRSVPWNSEFKIACVNNYGASGTNAAMIVMQPPNATSSLESRSAKPTPVNTYPVSITAFSPSSLAAYSSALLDFINESVAASNELALDISFHLSRRKNPNLPFSVCATVSSLQELKDLLKSTMSREPRKRENKPLPVVLLFGGQTGKASSVPRALYDSSTVFRKHLDDCDKTLRALEAPSIFPAAFEPGPEPVDDLVLSHSILFSGQYASAMAWLDCGLQPARLIGHSFGQYTAMCVSGVLSLQDSLRLVVDRARLISEHWGNDPGSMVAIEADLDKVSNLLTRQAHLGLEIACYNGPQSFVVAGSTSSVDALEAFLKSSSESLRWKRLEITNAFHSALAEPLIKPLQEKTAQLNLQAPKFHLETCSKDSTWQSITPDIVASYTREPVYFHQAVERISEQLGSCTWLEAGSAHGASMLRRALGTRISSHDVKSLKLDSSSSSLAPLAEVTAELWNLGHGVKFWPFHQNQQYQYGVLNIPLYQFDKSRHWLDWKELGAPVIEVQPPLPEQTSLLQLLQRTKDGAEFKINTRCEGWRKICSEQQILGVSICPVFSLLDLISDAIDMTQDTPIQESSAYNIQNLAIQCPIPADTDNGLTLTIGVTKYPQSWTFAVINASNSTHTYASGTVSTPSSNQSSGGQFARLGRFVNTTHIKNLTNDVEADSIKGKAVYKSLGNLFQLPETGQRVREVSFKGNEAAGYLVSQAKDPFVAIENVIQIPLLCLNGLQDRQDDQIYINTAMGYTESKESLGVSPDGNGSWAVYLKFFGLEGPETTCDILVFNAQSEQLSTIILDVSFTRMQIGSLRQALEGGTTLPQPNVSRDLEPSEAMKSAEPCPPPQQELDFSLIDHKTTPATDLPDLTKALFDVLVRVADVDVDGLHNDVLIAELGVDSLMGMEVAEEINNFFSIDIDTQEFVAASDIGSLCQLVASRTSAYFYDPKTSSGAQSEVLGTTNSSSGPPTSATSDTELSPNEQEPKTDSRLFSSPQSRNGLLNAALRTFDMIRDDYQIYAKETGCDKFYSQIYPHQASLVVAYITEAFAKLGCDLASTKAGEKIPKVPNAPKYDKQMLQLLRALQEDDLITRTGHDWIRTSKPLSVRPTSTERFNQIQTDFPQFAPEHELLHMVGTQLHDCLAGKLNPVALLFGSAAKRKLMADQYLTAPMQCSISKQLISFIKKCFSSQTIHETLRVLEIGGGTCGTTLHVVEAFAQLGIPIEYTFSDISSSFVTAAKSKLAQYDFVKYRTLDIIEDPPHDLKGYYDMIIATNVIHATPNVSKSARNTRKMLRPGGIMTLVEYTRVLYWGDIVFGQLDGWWVFDDGREHAIMDENGWKTTLERAGFDKIDWSGGRSEESKIVRIILAT